MAKIIDIEGIGPAFAEKLTAAGIKTTESLLKAGASPAGRKDIASRSGIDDRASRGPMSTGGETS